MEVRWDVFGSDTHSDSKPSSLELATESESPFISSLERKLLGEVIWDPKLFE